MWSGEVFVVDEDAEGFAEAFGMEERFEGEAGADIFFVGSVFENVGEGGGVAPSDGEEEIGLGDEASTVKSGARGGEVERGEIDVSGEVLFAGSGVEIFRGVVMEVSECGAAHVLCVVKLAGFAAVVDGDGEAALERSAGGFDPGGGGEAGFGELAVGEGSVEVAEVGGEGGSGGGEFEVGELGGGGRGGGGGGGEGDVEFAEGGGALDDAVEGEGVEEFVGEDAGEGEVGGE